MLQTMFSALDDEPRLPATGTTLHTLRQTAD
jgi:hypothetical protein